MGQRLSRRENAEDGGDNCVSVNEVNPRTPVTPTDHKAEVHPRPDETSVAIGGGRGGGQKKGREKNRLKKRRFRRFASLFCCFSRPKSTRAQHEPVEQGEVDQDAGDEPSRRCSESDGYTSLQDIVCTVEENDHQEPPFSSSGVYFSAEVQQMVADEPQDLDGSVCPSAGASASHLLRQLDGNEITRIEDHICWKYAIGKKMGEGGFGSVFEGTRCEDGLLVAVKFAAKTEHNSYICLPDHPRPVPLEVALTIKANQGPSCQHIIELLDWQDHLDQYIMVLERPLPCVDMHLFWRQHGDLFSEESARHFLRQVIDAAAVCCSRGVFHRDIKMPNLLVNTETLTVKLIDFGCGDLLKSSAYNTYTGTAMYSPPEYYEKGEYHGKEATVWSLGVLLFAMITSLFPDSSDIGLMDADIWFQPGFSDECCHFIRGCLQSNPEKRLYLEEMLDHDWFKLGPQVPRTASGLQIPEISVTDTSEVAIIASAALGPEILSGLLEIPVKATLKVLVAPPEPAEAPHRLKISGCPLLVPGVPHIDTPKVPATSNRVPKILKVPEPAEVKEIM
ncbi:serine/threonine-protein kinase pim-1-like [Garra rufa]|uniref:serine/threonine-protein kinase pim-1-like n=1 Tax=Garra rufa TaxID=137080 RepID=UPI003CCEB1D0